jgi:hypothetical protein
MDPYERYTRRSLRDTLVAEGVLTNEQADELIESAYETSEPFGSVLVESGYLTAWDLMGKVAATYQMPVMPLEGYRLDLELVREVPSTLLYQFQMLPLARFGQVWTWVAATPPTKDSIDALRERCGPAHFFYVGDMVQVQRLLQENVQVVDVGADAGWTDIFDHGDEAVQEEIGTEG